MPIADLGSRVMRRVRSWSRRMTITLAVLLVLLFVARLALPYIVKRQVNQRLASIPGYSGHVEDIGIALWRGAYSLKGLAIYRVNGEASEPFFVARLIDFSVAWRELFRGKIVSDIKIKDVEMNFVSAGTSETSQKDIDRRWQDVVQDIFPLEITRFEVTNGAVRYQDLTKVPAVDLFIKRMRLVATGLRNRSGEQGREYPAEITASGDSLGGGKLVVLIEADPLALQPRFHLDVKIDDVNLPDLNDSLKAYANVDVGRGTFRMVAEMAGKDGGFQGYIKPFFEHLDFNNIEDKKKGIFSRLWENAVAGLAWLVKNRSRDQVGTRIPFEGRFGDSKLGLWPTITNLFRHGFIQAFNPTIENSLNPENVLPTGKSADGKKVADIKDDAKLAPKAGEARAGARAGTPSSPPPAK